MKLYEMAAQGEGDILELGTHKGLSTSILAAGISTRQDGTIEAVDIDPTANIEARETISRLPGAERVNFVIMDATRRLNELIMMERKFGFVFVDHWHGYEATHDVATRLERLLLDGGFVLFHDAINVGNANPDHPYGVFQAIEDTIGIDRRFEFCGNFGCCSLYRFSEEKKVASTTPAYVAAPLSVVQKFRRLLRSLFPPESEQERQVW
jgi:predicted O-methyltransferase YrrM